MSLEAAEAADVIRQALMILSSVRRMNKYRLGLLTEGSAFIPARSMAITNGEAAAVPRTREVQARGIRWYKQANNSCSENIEQDDSLKYAVLL